MTYHQPRPTSPAYLGTLASQTFAQPIQWLWHDRIPQGRLTLLEGESGIGKSLLALHIAACVSTAHPLPDTTSPAKGGVIIISPSPRDTDTLKPRLQAAGADLSRIFFLLLPKGPTAAHSIAPDIDYLEAAIKDRGASLLIIDPLTPFLNRATRASRSLNFTLLIQLAQRTHSAFLLLRTISKPHPSSLSQSLTPTENHKRVSQLSQPLTPTENHKRVSQLSQLLPSTNPFKRVSQLSQPLTPTENHKRVSQLSQLLTPTENHKRVSQLSQSFNVCLAHSNLCILTVY